nr:glycosyl transferase family protein [Marinicella sp. W31]MDC2879258.1 glycosyl transferase family protein [Marinicella sp. W31]
MSLYWPFLFADYYRLLEYLTAGVAVIILVSCIDDLFIDAVFYLRAIKRRFTVERVYKRLTPDQLLGRPEQHIAIMVPAWLESDVIAAMIEGMVSTLDYRNYTVFVGTYRNDQATINEVERMRRRYRQLVRVEVPHDGPTCKADCLNWVVQAIFAHEEKYNITFAGTILHDSEDVLHPLELRFFNYLLPRIDLIQIPVNSLERDWHDLVAGVYMDEFAEWHGKDIVVREALSGMVPSAGVGTCFSHKALLTLSAENENEPFNTQTLTEDYDIGVRLSEHGMRSILARFPVDYQVKRKTWFGFGPEKEMTIRMALCVQEYFPNTFRTSYRQKARWSLGICFQGWAYFGWYGSLVDRYFLLRDRKSMVTVFVTILAYILALQYILFQFGFLIGILPGSYPPLLSIDGWLGIVLLLNTVALCLRVVQRFYFTSRAFGWEHGLIAIPRMIVANVVNFMAMSRAWKQYINHLITGNRLVWDKTMHDFPTGEGLVERQTKLGELLVSWHAINASQLETSLEMQKARRVPIGRILLDEGWLEEDVLAEAVAFQSSLDLISVTEDEVLAARDRFKPDFCFEYRVLAIVEDDSDRLALVSSFPLSPEALSAISERLGYEPLQFIARDREIAGGLRLLAATARKGELSKRDIMKSNIPLLGEILVENGVISNEALQSALSGYHPERDGLIGAYLVSRDVVFKDAVESALKEQQARMEAVREKQEGNSDAEEMLQEERS